MAQKGFKAWSGVSSGSKVLPEVSSQEIQLMIKEMNDQFNKRLADLKTEMKQFWAKIEDNLEAMKEQTKEEIKEEILPVFFAVDTNMQSLANKLEEMVEAEQQAKKRRERIEDRLDELERDLLTTKYKELEYVLRLRGLKEEKDQDLYAACVKAFATLLQVDEGCLDGQIVKVYRVNSWIAKQKNLPRDVLVYFERRRTRYNIAMAAYHKGFKIQGQEVRVIKEIPKKMWRMRKEFNFLTDELKNRGIQFRWEIPVGVALNYMGRRYWLHTVQKAQEFYSEVLKAQQSSSGGEKPLATSLEVGAAVLNGGSIKAGEVEKQKAEMVAEPADVRVTRSKSKKIKELA